MTSTSSSIPTQTLSAPLVRARRSKRRALWYQCYQLAGRLCMSDDLTQGQRKRLETLLLDVLSEPDRFVASTVPDLVQEALEP